MTIGIVTISFNQAEFLDEAMRSVTVDPPDNLEYVIVDPGSTDSSRQIIDSHRARLAAVVLEKDSGPADGLNRGFERLEKAEIFGYLNSDDRFAPGALNYVCEHKNRPTAGEYCDHRSKRKAKVSCKKR
jgi:glycosyltransferase involved in cell wall biosynthesis